MVNKNYNENLFGRRFVSDVFGVVTRDDRLYRRRRVMLDALIRDGRPVTGPRAGVVLDRLCATVRQPDAVLASHHAGATGFPAFPLAEIRSRVLVQYGVSETVAAQQFFFGRVKVVVAIVSESARRPVSTLIVAALESERDKKDCNIIHHILQLSYYQL